MLDKKYRYIGMDFETTGLDPNKDEPIQIGIVEIDVDGKIIDRYQSLIKPSKKKDELKDIVGFITGFSISDLENAPSREDVLLEISKFFGDNVVVVGHNIKFDIDFLANYFPELKHSIAIDTFQLSQTFVHYAPSYALEVLMQHLKDKGNGIDKRLKNFGLDVVGDTFHDAMHDTINSLALFMYVVDYIVSLNDKYPNLAHFLTQKDSFFSEILDIKDIEVISQIKFPVLEKISPSIISAQKNDNSIDILELENLKKYYIGNISINDLLAGLSTNKNIILSFSSLQKLDIAKGVLNKSGIKNLGFIKEDQTINENMFVDFLNKKVFSHEEVLFVLKYLSHLNRGYGILDLNNKFDYQIYSLIKDTRNLTNYPIVLATHGGLFSMLDDPNHAYRDYGICFMDVESRFKSYNYFLSRPCDVYYTLNLIETLIYKNDAIGQIRSSKTNENSSQVVSTKLNDFYQFFQIFIGELSIETKKLFTNNANDRLQHDPMIGSGDFYKTSSYMDKISGYLEDVKDLISESDFIELSKQISHMFNVFDSVVNISKKMYSQSDFYFVYSEENKFTSWQEFGDIFKDNKVWFFSNTNKELKLLKEGSFEPIIPIEFMEEKYDALINYLSEQKGSVFVVSTKKDQSKKIFEEIYKKRIHDRSLLLVENITGGIGKNIFKAKQDKGSKVLVGGYSFLLYAYANQLPIDEIIIFNINGSSKQSILDDIKRYAFK